MPAFVLTIGHSRHDWETFRDLLSPFTSPSTRGVLVDVRSNPVSRFAPWTNRKRLPTNLAELDLDYAWMGDRLGGKPKNRSLYDEKGRPDFTAIRATPTFTDGMARLIDLAGRRTVILMCGEEDPAGCHRTLAVGPGLVAAGFALRHIRKTGVIETETDLA